MRGWRRKVVRLLGRARELFPLTNLGLAVTIVAAVALWGFAIPRVDYVVQLVAMLALALVGLALSVVLLGALLTHRALIRGETGPSSASPRKPEARGERSERSRVAPSPGPGPGDPVAFEARRGFAEVLRLPARRWLPLLEVSWRWEEPAGFVVTASREDGVLREIVEAHARASSPHITRRFVVEDGFGLARLVLRRREARPVRVTPWTGALDRAPILRSLASGEDLPHPLGDPNGDRVDMRRYVQGDPLRLALWKVYARTRQLMVRTPERALSPAVKVAAYLPAALGDEPAAAAAKVAVEGNHLGERWSFSADGARQAASDADGARALIVASKAVKGGEEGDAAGLRDFLEELGRSEPVKLVLFVPGRPGPWLTRVVEAARRHRGGTHAVIGVDGIRDDGAEARASVRWRRVIEIPEAPREEDEAVVSPAELEDVVRVLSSAGIEVSAFDRQSGRALGLGLAAHRSAQPGTASAFGRSVA